MEGIQKDISAKNEVDGLIKDDEESEPKLKVSSCKQDPEKQAESQASWFIEFLLDWIATILIGFLVTTYWRGTWVLFDLYTCGQPQDATLERGDTYCFGADPLNSTRLTSGWSTYIVGNTLLLVGVSLMWCGWWTPKQPDALTFARVLQRIIVLYVLGMGTVCIWRGIWYATDYLILPSEPLASFWTTTVCGLVGAFVIFSGPSVLAPPAIFNMDGPSVNPPPVAVTIVSSYFSITLPAGAKPPKVKTIVNIVDLLLSFVVLPILVVWFWRGVWLLLDQYLWGFTASTQDVRNSIGYGALLGLGLLFLGSDSIVIQVPNEAVLVSQTVSRLRTVVLAVGAVSFWRSAWLIWDEYCGTTFLCGWLNHWLAIAVLTLMGCLSCITAPPSTLGVDAIAGEDCADEPLFHDIPVPSETIFWFAIARRQQLPISEEVNAPPASMNTLIQLQRPEFSCVGSARVTRNSDESLTQNVLSRRHALKRKNNQFFRVR